MAWGGITYTFSPSTTARSSEVNQNFQDLVANVNTGMPSGGIIAWSGAIVDIPAGWYLCDGNNGTPNLVGKFIQGAGSGYSVGATGGSASIDLRHRHYDDHTHTYAHNHTVWRTAGGGYSGAGLSSSEDYRGTTIDQSTSTTSAKSSGGYTDYQLSSTQESRPPFYTLAYIMKS